MSESTRKTDEEIMERIKPYQEIAEEEEGNGGIGNGIWWDAKTAIHELRWVLGE